MDKKILKEEKKKQKLEKFLNKKLNLKNIEKGNKTQKKINTGGYDPSKVEEKWNNFWIEENLFSSESKTEKFVMSMPPPNITGSLHIGHAMMVAIQDSICRYMRMNDFEVLYVPGTDHAGIATQTVVMKQLEKENKKCDRETFLNATWEWKNKYGTRILEQFKRLGTSADNNRLKFTMDPDMNRAVVEAFCRFYEKGLIYRDNKIVNWCCKLQTTLSDIEINHLSVQPNTFLKVDNRNYEFGVIYVFKYPVVFTKGDLEEEGYLEVGTTRPETILGDVALCVNPKDNRYNKYDKIIPINPLTNEKLQFVFDEAVDIDLESGVLKLSPAHDPIDFEIAKTHKLEQIQIFDSHNKIKIKGEFYNLSRLDARDKVIEKLKQLNLFIIKKPHEQILPICSRSNDLIEPIIKEQWWCRCKEMSKKAIDVVKTNQIKFYPEESKEDWYRWFENPRDWCLSRQLWWGHRIPAYKTPNNIWTIGRTKQEAIKLYHENYPEKEKYLENDFLQDEDVLDTWFSSGLWPFATLGWPDESPDFQKYFPTTLMETGKDILFFWVGRMVMMSLELTGKIPFKNVLLHGIVRDANGRKMSKSLGNVIDPIHVIDGTTLENLIESMKLGNVSSENQKNATSIILKDFPNGIEACGADALRITLLSYMNGIHDIKLDLDRVLGNRKFCNKIWNASIFVKKVLEDYKKNNSFINYDIIFNIDFSIQTDKLLVWIIQKRNKVIEITHNSFKSYKFMPAVQAIHQFFLYDFCDVYIEIVKKVKRHNYIQILFCILIDSIKIFNPYMPFITEEIFSQYFENSLLRASFPKIVENDNFSNFSDLLVKIKSIRADVEKFGKEKVDVVLDEKDNFENEDLEFISALIPSIKDISIGKKFEIKH